MAEKTIKEQFFYSYGIDQRCKSDRFDEDDQCCSECICDYVHGMRCDEKYLPEITAERFLELENIFAHEEMDESGFFLGFDVKQNSFGTWEYEIGYRKGGSYWSRGESRYEALLNLFIKIYEDKEVDEDEKRFIRNKVQKIFSIDERIEK